MYANHAQVFPDARRFCREIIRSLGKPLDEFGDSFGGDAERRNIGHHSRQIHRFFSCEGSAPGRKGNATKENSQSRRNPLVVVVGSYFSVGTVSRGISACAPGNLHASETRPHGAVTRRSEERRVGKDGWARW